MRCTAVVLALAVVLTFHYHTAVADEQKSFDEVDANKDGLIDREEWAKVQSAVDPDDRTDTRGKISNQEGDIGDASLQSLDISPSAQQCVGVLKAEVLALSKNNRDVKRRFESLLRETRNGHVGTKAAKTMPLSTKPMKPRRHRPRAKPAPQRQIALSRSESQKVQKHLRESFNRAVATKKAVSETANKQRKMEQKIREFEKQKAKVTAKLCGLAWVQCKGNGKNVCRKCGVRAVGKRGCTVSKAVAHIDKMRKKAPKKLKGLFKNTSRVISEGDKESERVSKNLTAAKQTLAKLRKAREKSERGANSCSIELGSQVRVAAFDTGSPTKRTGSRGFCVLGEGKQVPEFENSHLYCASSTLISRKEESYVTACRTKDKGRIVVQNVVGKKVEIRDENGFKKTLCLNYIKVAGCTKSLNSRASNGKSKKQSTTGRMCAENKVLLKCSACTKGQTDCQKCSGSCAGARISATMNV